MMWHKTHKFFSANWLWSQSLWQRNIQRVHGGYQWWVRMTFWDSITITFNYTRTPINRQQTASKTQPQQLVTYWPTRPNGNFAAFIDCSEKEFSRCGLVGGKGWTSTGGCLLRSMIGSRSIYTMYTNTSKVNYRILSLITTSIVLRSIILAVIESIEL